MKEDQWAMRLVAAEGGGSTNSGDECHRNLLLEAFAVGFPSPCIRWKLKTADVLGFPFEGFHAVGDTCEHGSCDVTRG